MRIHFIIHERFEAPAAIEAWAKESQHSVTYTHLSGGDTLPSHCDDFDFLCIMGGPQSPSTTREECPYFDGPKEIAFIKQAIDNNKLVLGVCLGAQLIGEAYGASYEHSPHKEIGVFDITLTDAAKQDPIFSQFPTRFPSAHWHGDMPGLTADATILATSEGCPRQIIRYAPTVYGFQCHLEFTQQSTAGMIEECQDELNTGGTYVQSAEQLSQSNFNNINQKLFQFLNQFCLVTSDAAC